jgi:2-succinyl-6-hydroxy-2,4-cyclohexadiene-1-carboxylate synthase
VDSHPPSPPSLTARRIGVVDASAPRIVLVHGFTQSSECWSPIDDDLANDHEVVLVDAPGHGASAEVQIDLVDAGRAATAVGGAGTYVGYSMGGRICLHAALDEPEAVTGLVVVSATAGIDDADERAERRWADDQLADHLVEVGTERFVDEWLAQPLFATLAPERAHRQARLANTAAGLASSLRLAGTGTQLPLWDRLGELDMPVLVVAGALDPKYVALAERLATTVGANAELAVIDGAGHTVHLEQPAAFLSALRAWDARTRHV